MHEYSTATIFGSHQAAVARMADQLPHVRLNPMALCRQDMDAAKAISLSTFDAEPDVLRLQAQIDERKRRVMGELQQWLQTQLAAITSEITTSEKAIARAVFLDAKARDVDFPKTAASMAQIQYLKGLEDSISGAMDSLEPFADEAVRADQTLRDLGKILYDQLWILRVRHLEALRNQEIDRLNGLALEGSIYE